MAKKVKVQHAGQEIEVELPDDFLTPDEARGRFTQEHLDRVITDRLARFGRSMRKELLADEEFRTEALAAWQINVNPDDKKKGNGTPPEEAIQNALKEFERTRLAPLEKEKATLASELESMREHQLHSDILSGATGIGFKKPYLKPLPGSQTPAVVAMVKAAFGYDPERKAWFAKSADGKSFAISMKPDPAAGHPYKGVQEFFTELANDPEYRDYLESPQSGANLSDRRTTSGGQKVISANDPEAFGREAENIFKGTTIVE